MQNSGGEERGGGEDWCKIVEGKKGRGQMSLCKILTGIFEGTHFEI